MNQKTKSHAVLSQGRAGGERASSVGEKPGTTRKEEEKSLWKFDQPRNHIRHRPVCPQPAEAERAAVHAHRLYCGRPGGRYPHLY